MNANTNMNTNTAVEVTLYYDKYEAYYGDGLYPVYVKLNDDGCVSMVVIDFEGNLDEEQE